MLNVMLKIFRHCFYFMFYFLLGVNGEIKTSHYLVLPHIYETLRLTFKQPLLLAVDEFPVVKCNDS